MVKTPVTPVDMELGFQTIECGMCAVVSCGLVQGGTNVSDHRMLAFSCGVLRLYGFLELNGSNSEGEPQTPK